MKMKQKELKILTMSNNSLKSWQLMNTVRLKDGKASKSTLQIAPNKISSRKIKTKSTFPLKQNL